MNRTDMLKDDVLYKQAFARDLPAAKGRENATPKYNFATGHNNPEAIPSVALAEAAAAVLRREGKSLALYNLGGSALGYRGLREVVAEKLQKYRGIACSADDVLITTGSLQGIDFVNQLLLDRGDTVIVEQFTYIAVIGKLKTMGVEAIPAPLDAGGIDMARLEDILAGLAAEGRRPKYIYTIPTVQNPTGSVLDMERRRRLIDLALKFQTPIFEDECYADLIWAGEAPPSLYSMAPDNVIHIGSFSKTLAPALRVGYLVAPWEALGQILALKSDGGTGALDQMVVAEYFREHFHTHIEMLTARLKRKLDVLLEALDREFGTLVEITVPVGGLFAWLKFPDDIDVRTLSKPAAELGVAFNPGNEWSVRAEDGLHHIRVCFGLTTEGEIEEGIAALARACFRATGRPASSSNIVNAA
ncbi:PLP-dependent aminotransferase family protein [Sinorhizobium medicae]|uniref:aminotransferase-like domain-containing protein n=1 Tax=Sinorhizobium medicae TaxID=110321 RepID=UPI000FD6CD31|nr:PLP-dependent aminotransferase family protein [Sinorhizobium medicae]RVH84097.1 PLP-dependent aminotransferase family protein [Sinorhizobium medicae]RVP59602.1 PLP-dependent aminotransferase family protein [Sinorhizobium medicae]